MEMLYAIFAAPFIDMFSDPVFFAEVVINGLLTGIMYSLVALGFVLIFKASGVFNFAQGAMVLFAPLTLVGLMEQGVPVIPALIITAAVMVLLAFLIEKFMLRHLINQEGIVLFMATIGLNFVLEGAGQIAWGSNVKKLDVGIPDESFEWGGILLNTFDIAAEIIGIEPLKTKLLAFAISSFYCGVAGALFIFAWLGSAETEAFDIFVSFQVLFMIIIGGLGSILGSILGAAFITLTPIFLTNFPPMIGLPIATDLSKHLEEIIFGALIVFFLIVEPLGLARLWQIIKEKLRLWPYPY